MPDSGFCKDCKHCVTARPINGGSFLGCGMSSYLINLEVALKIVEADDTCTDYEPRETRPTQRSADLPSATCPRCKNSFMLDSCPACNFDFTASR